MAAFAVAFDGTRVVDASVTTGWTAETATPTAETDFFYQGAGCISAQVKTSETGFYYTSSSTSMTGKTWLAKVIITNKDALDGNGLVLRIGSATTAYYNYNVFSATTYPIPGGFQILAIDPNVSQWRTGTTGSPNLGAVIYWAIRGDCSATSKAPNLGMDAIDWITNGTGLTGTGGDGASADGTFADFVTADEGTANNRWGIVATRGGVLYVTGVLTIGTSTETDFTDSNVVIVFPDHRVTTGFCGIDFGLQNANSVISITNCVFRGRGALSSSDDTRPDYTVSGTSGTLSILGTSFNVFRQIDWNSKCTIQNCNFISGLLVVGAGADLRGSTFDACTGAADSSYLSWDVNTDPDGKLDDVTFTKGSTATHAISFGTTSPTTMTLRRIAFSGYNASNSQNDSTLYIARTTGTVTINLIGCSGNISYKSAGATVVLVNDPVTVAVTVLDKNNSPIQNAQVSLYRTSDNLEIINADTNASGVASVSYSGTTPAAVYWRVRKGSSGGTKYKSVSGIGTIAASTGFSATVTLLVNPINNA